LGFFQKKTQSADVTWEFKSWEKYSELFHVYKRAQQMNLIGILSDSNCAQKERYYWKRKMAHGSQKKTRRNYHSYIQHITYYSWAV
jgi:hypothetical protein